MVYVLAMNNWDQNENKIVGVFSSDEKAEKAKTDYIN
jgi:hypothetical protein